MPVFHITLKREDPDSEAYEITEGDVSDHDAKGAMDQFREAADAFGHAGWQYRSMTCELRNDMIMEGEEPTQRKSWLCRFFGC